MHTINYCKFQQRKTELETRIQAEEERESDESKREDEFAKVIEAEKQKLDEERKKLEEEKTKFLQMTTSYREAEEKELREQETLDSGLGSRSETAEVICHYRAVNVAAFIGSSFFSNLYLGKSQS